MVTADWGVKDPTARYKELVDAVGATMPPVSSLNALTGAIQSALDAAGTGEPDLDAVASVIAQHTPFTAEQAKPIVAAAMTRGTNPAASIAAATTSAAFVIPTISLSDPVMLGPKARLVFSWMLSAVLSGTIVSIVLLAAFNTSAAAPYTVLGVLSGLSLLAMVVLVMGYKSVTISGGSSSGSNSSSGKAAS